jgi:hypothetical protein
VVVAEVLHPTFSVRRYLFVSGPGSCDEQAANVIVERLSRRPCTYVARPCAHPPFVEQSCQLPRLLVLCGEVLGVDKVSATDYVRFKALIYLRELTSSIQRAALRDAWGTLSLADPHSSSLAHYENMWSLVGSTQSFENTDK